MTAIITRTSHPARDGSEMMLSVEQRPDGTFHALAQDTDPANNWHIAATGPTVKDTLTRLVSAGCHLPEFAPNARLWAWHCGGWVKITLRPGESLTAHEGGPCDEGYHHEATRYTHEGDHVTRAYGYSSADCDGRYDGAAVMTCPLADLAADPAFTDYDGTNFPVTPKWTEESSGQRDHTAEAAGY